MSIDKVSNPDRACTSTFGQVVKGGAILTLVSAAAITAFKTAPLWVPALVAAGPIGWAVLGGVGLVAALVALGVYAYKSNKQDIEADKVNPQNLQRVQELKNKIIDPNFIKKFENEKGLDNFLQWCVEKKVDSMVLYCINNQPPAVEKYLNEFKAQKK